MKKLITMFREWRRTRAWSKLSERDRRLCMLLGGLDEKGRHRG